MLINLQLQRPAAREQTKHIQLIYRAGIKVFLIKIKNRLRTIEAKNP